MEFCVDQLKLFVVHHQVLTQHVRISSSIVLARPQTTHVKPLNHTNAQISSVFLGRMESKIAGCASPRL
jgi:hypothetical protein